VAELGKLAADLPADAAVPSCDQRDGVHLVNNRRRMTRRIQARMR
jgi:hypothetical protein